MLQILTLVCAKVLFYLPIIMYWQRSFIVTCNFVVTFMWMNNVCIPSFNFIELVCENYDHIYFPIIMYCLRLFVVVLQELYCLKTFNMLMHI